MTNPIAVSTWALHRALGVAIWHLPEGTPDPDGHHFPSLTLKTLGDELFRRGIDRVELCHFHLPSSDPTEVAPIGAWLRDSGVTVQSLLIDGGDITDPVYGERDARWISEWVAAAGALGAERARVIGGKSAGPDAFAAAVHHLGEIAAAAGPVRVMVENWFDVMSTPEAVNHVLDALDGKVGLCVDFGNWPAPRKYTELPLIFDRAETCHAKCEIDEAGRIDEADYDRCLALARRAGFTGPLVIVNGGPGDEWAAIESTAAYLRAA